METVAPWLIFKDTLDWLKVILPPMTLTVATAHWEEALTAQTII